MRNSIYNFADPSAANDIDFSEVEPAVLEVSTEGGTWHDAIESAFAQGLGMSVSLVTIEQHRPCVFSWDGQIHQRIFPLEPEESLHFSRACRDSHVVFDVGQHVKNVPMRIQNSAGMGAMALFAADEIAGLHALLMQRRLHEILPPADPNKRRPARL